MPRRCCFVALALESLTAVACVLGLSAFLWWLLGRLLRPLPGGSAFVLIRGEGEGVSLEQTVRGFIWLRGLGLLHVPILIADMGLSPSGRELALHLCARWPGVILWPVGELEHYLKKF